MRARIIAFSSITVRLGLLALIAVWVALLWPRASAFAKPAPAPVDLTVSAAISLTEALQKIRTLYRAQAPDLSITLNLGASGILQQQIQEGAPADIFISASPVEMNALEAEGLLLPGSRIDLLQNTLVLICPSFSHDISHFRDLAQPRVKRIAMANPESVPAGMYAEEALKYFHLYSQVKSKLILGQDVRQTLAYVETGNVDAGIVYLTEARLSNKVKVVADAPDASHAPIVYPAAIVKRCPHPGAAKKFIEFLTSAQARQVFEVEGFAIAGNSE